MAPFSVDDPLEQGFRLDQNFPNPFSNSTTLGFALKSPADVVLSLYDARGRYITTLLDDHYQSGSHNFSLDLRNSPQAELSSGLYFVRLKTNDAEFLKGITVIR